MTRITDTFAALDRPALITFMTAGYPDLETSTHVLETLATSGSDIIEIGVPFTDPMADGEIIQQSSFDAVANGTSVSDILDMVRTFRESHDTPIVLMGYANPVFAYGMECFARNAAAAGVDGVIMVDLPPEESGEFLPYAQAANLDFIRLVTPTTDSDRLKIITEGASGFLYYVSITGVTGTAKPDPAVIKSRLDEIRKQTDIPLAVGFGIKTPEDAAAMGAIADGVVVGSSLVQTITDHAGSAGLLDKVATQVRELADALK